MFPPLSGGVVEPPPLFPPLSGGVVEPPPFFPPLSGGVEPPEIRPLQLVPGQEDQQKRG
ncbi:hypothetical protein I6A45_15355, partial [Clostridioides difficile]|nr:hypothetical protein [Clostridioides difficile]